jgi:hypothetical protein
VWGRRGGQRTPQTGRVGGTTGRLQFSDRLYTATEPRRIQYASQALNQCPARRRNGALPLPHQLIERDVKWRAWRRSLTRRQLTTRWSLSGRCGPDQRWVSLRLVVQRNVLVVNRTAPHPDRLSSPVSCRYPLMWPM